MVSLYHTLKDKRLNAGFDGTWWKTAALRCPDLGATHSSEGFTHTNSFSPHRNPMN